MASRGKKKTTFAKLARESKLREKRMDKQARKEARRAAAENPPSEYVDVDGEVDADADVDEPAVVEER
jgi:dephospho-CoA kinase